MSHKSGVSSQEIRDRKDASATWKTIDSVTIVQPKTSCFPASEIAVEIQFSCFKAMMV